MKVKSLKPVCVSVVDLYLGQTSKIANLHKHYLELIELLMGVRVTGVNRVVEWGACSKYMCAVVGNVMHIQEYKVLDV